jgi:glycosyltransferase involved in cell wall biosynthesis
LPLALSSVLNQTITDFTICIIADGAPQELLTVIKKWQKKDKRIKSFIFPKGERNGEQYRHDIVRAANTPYVAYMSDDDLWLPTHLEQLLPLLQKGNFVHSLPTYISPQGKLEFFIGDLKSTQYRHWLLTEKRNFIPLHCAAHTLKLYTSLPIGWHTTPAGIHTDLYMWQQFLNHPSCKPVSGTVPTTIHLPSSLRRQATQEERLRELNHWATKLKDPHFPAQYQELIFQSQYQQMTESELKLELFRRSFAGGLFHFFSGLIGWDKVKNF